MRWARGVAALAVVGVAGGAAYAGMRMLETGEAAAPGASPGATASATASPSPEAEPTLAWGPTVAQWEQALADAQALSLEQAAGQVIVASWSSPDGASAAATVESLHLGGLVLMSGSMLEYDQVEALTAAVQAVGDRDWPVIIATDQEGGTVARLAGIIPDMPGFLAAGSLPDKTLVTQAYRGVGADMLALGFTMNFAPVADVTVGMADPVIRTRSAGSDPATVAATAIAAGQGFVEAGVVPTLKHFPGHGSVTTDSHDALPVQTRTVAEMSQADLLPFARGIEAGLPAIMTGHIQVPEWGDAPASLSPQAHAYLRDELGFEGVIVTDALNMGAVTAAYGAGEAAVAALAAGADVLLMPADPAQARAAIVDAVISGTVSRARLDEAAARSILLMRWQESLPRAAGDGSGQYASTFASQAATVAAATCEAPLLAGPVRVVGGLESDRVAFADALAVYGIPVGSTGTTVRLLGADDRSGNGDVVIAMGGPWGLPSSQASVYVGAYGRSPDVFVGVVAVLTGAATSQGVWAVDVTGVPYAPCAG